MEENTLVTTAGQADIATASFLKQTVNWNTMVVGDANGQEYIPSESQTRLVNQVWSGAIETYRQINATQGEFKATIPSSVGGFTIREIGILNEEGDLVALAVIQPRPKVALGSGSGGFDDMTLNFQVAISDASIVKILVDPNVVTASQDYVDQKMDELKEELEKKVIYECDENDIQEAMGISWGGSGGDPGYRVATTDEVVNAFKQGLSS